MPDQACILIILLTGYYEYKAPGVLEDFPPDLLADVNMDFNYRKEQDEFVQELYEKECNGEAVVYWEVESPSPKFSRDVSFPKNEVPKYLKNMVNACYNYHRRT
ncbi:phosphatidylcholine transfer protein-like [Hippopotamus amphibius kiboko]|uniref:phosphatidylcholine transfer protein-like n=1 Tax=Hippopotamus amphibius kiboko TaxID=575201 RepID=UPI00259A42AC|nr:phosphatidylcholine transfer protein-like [Hippopotamus amphibius kiboko]